MPTSNLRFPEIDASDLKAALEFLTSFRDESSPAPAAVTASSDRPAPHTPPAPARRRPSDGFRAPVTVHNGITRARGHVSAGKSRG